MLYYSLLYHLMPTDYFMHHNVERSNILHGAHRIQSTFLRGYQNGELSFPYAALNDWFFLWRSVFTVQYKLSFLASRQNCEKQLLDLSCLSSTCPSACRNSAKTEQIFMKFDVWVFFENLLSKTNFHYNLWRITGTLHEDQYPFFIISRSIRPRMRNVSDRSFRETRNTQFLFKNFPPPSPRQLRRLWDNVEKNFWGRRATNDNTAHAQCIIDTQG